MDLTVLIVYYSTFGNTYKMALEVAEGVKAVPGAIPVIRTVPELIPEEVIQSREDIRRGKELQKEVPLVTLDDFRKASAIAFGTPTRFGVVSAQLKNQIDRLSPLWQERALEGKPAGIFVSTSTLHGGQEMTIFSLLPALLHLGMIFVGVPYSVKELFTTKGGGSPYGPGHVAGDNSQRELDEEEKAILRAFGKRLAEIALKLNK
ncbi:MAG: NAD(P)H:quinone oxidoreductase [Caldimicrobium sp.]